MSNNWNDPREKHHHIATLEKDIGESQGNERLSDNDLISGLSTPVAMALNNDYVEADITAGQKMLSAMSGSLLTSLLGESSHQGHFYGSRY